jgi:predicted RNase H-like nuclease
MTIEGAQGWIVIRAGHGSRGVLLLSARSFQRASATVGFLA